MKIKIKPVDGIINLTIGDAQAMKNFHQLSLLLLDFRNYGSIIIRSIFLDDTITIHVRKVISVLLQKVIEDIDAISVLINEAVSEPCFLNLRRLYENYIYLKFILKEEKEMEERAKAYYYFYLRNEIKDAEMYDFSTPLGKQQMSKMKSDKKYIDLSSLSIDSKNIVDKNNRILYEPQYKSIKDEIDRIKEVNKEIRKNWKKGEKGGGKLSGDSWYSLFDGPTSIEVLSNKVGCAALYFLYRRFSAHLHLEKSLENLNSPGNDKIELAQIRNPENAQNNVLMTLEFGYLSFYTVLETLQPQCLKCFLFYYKNNIEPDRVELRNSKIFNMNWETVSDR